MRVPFLIWFYSGCLNYREMKLFALMDIQFLECSLKQNLASLPVSPFPVFPPHNGLPLPSYRTVAMSCPCCGGGAQCSSPVRFSPLLPSLPSHVFPSPFAAPTLAWRFIYQEGRTPCLIQGSKVREADPPPPHTHTCIMEVKRPLIKKEKYIKETLCHLHNESTSI